MASSNIFRKITSLSAWWQITLEVSVASSENWWPNSHFLNLFCYIHEIFNSAVQSNFKLQNRLLFFIYINIFRTFDSCKIRWFWNSSLNHNIVLGICLFHRRIFKRTSCYTISGKIFLTPLLILIFLWSKIIERIIQIFEN